MDDVVESKVVSTPIHARDCCLVTDGGAAVVVPSAARAATLPHPPVYLLGFSESSNHRTVSAMPDLTSTVAAQTSRLALETAGRSLSEIDTAHVYYAFTASLLILLEDIGFCGKGEGGPFVEEGNIAPGGTLALNTNGAGLSFTHPGMLALFCVASRRAADPILPGCRPDLRSPP